MWRARRDGDNWEIRGVITTSDLNSLVASGFEFEILDVKGKETRIKVRKKDEVLDPIFGAFRKDEFERDMLELSTLGLELIEVR